jgi:hypothetical protein
MRPEPLLVVARLLENIRSSSPLANSLCLSTRRRAGPDAFATDFLGYRQFGSIKYLVGYLPFAVLSVAGPLFCCRVPATRCTLADKFFKTSWLVQAAN